MTLDVGLEVPAGDLATLLRPGPGGVPEQLDSSGAAYVVLGAERAHRGAAASPSPSVVAAVLARRTRGVGIVVATSPQRDHPYNAARRVASLDHLSGGRAGLLALPRDTATGLGAGADSVWLGRPLGVAERVDALVASRKLWRTWPVRTLDEDPEVARGVVVRHADHVGSFSTQGPLNVPTTPQGEPVVFWAAAGGQGEGGAEVVEELVSAASVADVLVVDHDRLSRPHRLRLDDALEPVAAAGRPARLHLRLPADAPGLERTLLGLASDALVSGVVLVTPPSALPTVTGLLSRLGAHRAIRRRPTDAPATLRDLLDVPRRAEPDLSDHRAAFAAL